MPSANEPQTAQSKRGIVPPLHGDDPHRRVTMAIHIDRREFIATVGGAAAARPLAAAFALGTTVSRPAVAQDWPARPCALSSRMRRADLPTRSPASLLIGCRGSGASRW